jgi:hypothetical protein
VSGENQAVGQLCKLIASERDARRRQHLLSRLHSALKAEQAVIKNNVDEFVKRYWLFLSTYGSGRTNGLNGFHEIRRESRWDKHAFAVSVLAKCLCF